MLVERFLTSADQFADRVAASDPTRQMTFADLARLANVLRRYVEKTTSQPRVGLMLPSSAGFVGAFYGILWAGRTAIPLNFLLQPAEIAGVVADSGIDTVFAIKHFAPLLDPLPIRKIYLEDLSLKRDMVLERIRRKPAAPAVAPDDLAVILYTSGTAGQPKGVCLSHANLSTNVAGCIAAAKLKGEHRFVGLLPLFHTFGLTALLLVPVALGSSTHYLPRFSAQQVISAIRSERLNVMMAVASIYGALVRHRSATAEDLASLTYAISGGEPLPDTVYHTFHERFGRTLVQGYGLTETSPVVSLDLPWSHRQGTVGRAIPQVEVAAYDDTGAPLAPGRTGELWVRGPGIMKGYFNKPEETAAVITPQHWFKTGDMGFVSEDGYISITGRKKEMIIVGGENVYPREIESVLDTHPAVAESAVVGHGDASRGETVVAFVVPREDTTVTEIELREFCRGKLATYKVPRSVVIRTDLPRGPTGKLMKRRLKELLE